MLLATSVFVNPIVVGLVVGLPVTVATWFGLRRGWKADRIATQLGAATVQGAQVSTVIEGLNNLVERLQAQDEARLREIDRLEKKIDDLRDELESRDRAHEARIAALKQQISDLSDRIP